MRFSFFLLLFVETQTVSKWQDNFSIENVGCVGFPLVVDIKIRKKRDIKYTEITGKEGF
jgi:hypothetical protein